MSSIGNAKRNTIGQYETAIKSAESIGGPVPYNASEEVVTKLSRLGAATDEAINVLAVLSARLSPVLHPWPVNVAGDEAPPSPVPLAAEIEVRARKVEAIAAQLRDLTDRLGI